MNRREMHSLLRRIERVAGVRVSGVRRLALGQVADYEIDCVDERTGIPFVVRSAADWTEWQHAASDSMA